MTWLGIVGLTKIDSDKTTLIHTHCHIYLSSKIFQSKKNEVALKWVMYMFVRQWGIGELKLRLRTRLTQHLYGEYLK